MRTTADIDDDLLRAARRRAWIQFVRTGDPNHPGLPAWPRHRASAPTALAVSTEPATISWPV